MQVGSDTHSTRWGWRPLAGTASGHWAAGCGPGRPASPGCSSSRCPSPLSAARCLSFSASESRHSPHCSEQGSTPALRSLTPHRVSPPHPHEPTGPPRQHARETARSSHPGKACGHTAAGRKGGGRVHGPRGVGCQPGDSFRGATRAVRTHVSDDRSPREKSVHTDCAPRIVRVGGRSPPN